MAIAAEIRIWSYDLDQTYYLDSTGFDEEQLFLTQEVATIVTDAVQRETDINSYFSELYNEGRLLPQAQFSAEKYDAVWTFRVDIQYGDVRVSTMELDDGVRASADTFGPPSKDDILEVILDVNTRQQSGDESSFAPTSPKSKHGNTNQRHTEVYEGLSPSRQQAIDAFLEGLLLSPVGYVINPEQNTGIEYKFRDAIASLSGVSMTTVINTIEDNSIAILQRASDLELTFDTDCNPIAILSASNPQLHPVAEEKISGISYRYSDGPRISTTMDHASDPYVTFESMLVKFHEIRDGWDEIDTYLLSGKGNRLLIGGVSESLPVDDETEYPDSPSAAAESYSDLTLSRQLAVDGLIAAMKCIPSGDISYTHQQPLYCPVRGAVKLPVSRELLSEAASISGQPISLVKAVILENLHIVEERTGIASFEEWLDDGSSDEVEYPDGFKIPVAQIENRAIAHNWGRYRTSRTPEVPDEGSVYLSYLDSERSCLDNLTWREQAIAK